MFGGRQFAGGLSASGRRWPGRAGVRACSASAPRPVGRDEGVEGLAHVIGLHGVAVDVELLEDGLVEEAPAVVGGLAVCLLDVVEQRQRDVEDTCADIEAIVGLGQLLGELGALLLDPAEALADLAPATSPSVDSAPGLCPGSTFACFRVDGGIAAATLGGGAFEGLPGQRNTSVRRRCVRPLCRTVSRHCGTRSFPYLHAEDRLLGTSRSLL